jgi:hypothetical protein
MNIKAEVPSKSVGRLLDAVTDAIRPFTERQGLRADQIRLQREDVLIKIAAKARERLKIEEGIKPIPNKFLVPFMERASLEEEDSILIDWWANLLRSAAQDETTRNPIFIDILGKMTPRDAIFLERVWAGSTHHEMAIATSLHHRLESSIARLVLDRCNLNDATIYPDQLSDVLKSQIEVWKKEGVFCEHVTYPKGSDRGFMESRILVGEELDICVALGLLTRVALDLAIPTPWIGEFSCSGEFVYFSKLGIRLMKASHHD